MASALRVSVESLAEHLVQEVALDGQETFVKPLSMSDNLTKLAHKIDFSTSEEEPTEAAKDAKKELDTPDSKEATPTSFQPPTWPWESVRNKLRMALTEMSVLSDILQISRWAKEPPYMVLDPVSQEAPPPVKQVQIIQLVDKKTSLTSAASILLKGAQGMTRPQNVAAGTAKVNQESEFHAALHRLRLHWRLKKVGNNILGDLSFKTAGSRFWHSGMFEVTKTPEEDMEDTPERKACPLKVTVPSDLEGTSYIQVLIKEGEAEIAIAFAIQSSRSKVSEDPHWQERLEAAQNVLFCKEAFAQIAREAVQLKSPIPHLVVGNQIICNIFPGVQLCITLCHDTSMDKQIEPMVKAKHSHALELSLHHLLRELHRSNLNGQTPRPVTASHTISKRRRLAGPQAMSLKQLAEMQQTECLLEKLLKQAKHIVLRSRTALVIDELSGKLQDTCLMGHWSALTQPLQTTVKIYVTSTGYESLGRSSLQLIIDVDYIRAINKDGRIIKLSHEQQELRDLLLCQVSQHQVNTVSTLSKAMGMQILQYNFHVGVGPVAKLGNASAIMIATPNGNRKIAVRSDPLEGIQVLVQGAKVSQSATCSPKSNVVTDFKWESLPSGYHEVNMSRMPGKNFLNKMELLLATLAQQ
ncbi:mediator of RNA polymerase II transcription subunit 17-like [Amphiura filiformis]|uniref:mediator of RNA polymerase II transcription subunit 17-like n=1 Tax=Amphiura filiformis TaxID=82378 RepID=UPI003B228293